MEVHMVIVVAFMAVLLGVSLWLWWCYRSRGDSDFDSGGIGISGDDCSNANGCANDNSSNCDSYGNNSQWHRA